MDLVDDVRLGEVKDVVVALEALWVGLELLSWSTYMYTYTQDKTIKNRGSTSTVVVVNRSSMSLSKSEHTVIRRNIKKGVFTHVHAVVTLAPGHSLPSSLPTIHQSLLLPNLSLLHFWPV